MLLGAIWLESLDGWMEPNISMLYRIQQSKSLSSVLWEMNDDHQWLQCPTDVSQMAAHAWWCLIFDSWPPRRQCLRDGSQGGFGNNMKMKTNIIFSRTADPRTWRTKQPPKCEDMRARLTAVDKCFVSYFSQLRLHTAPGPGMSRREPIVWLLNGRQITAELPRDQIS